MRRMRTLSIDIGGTGIKAITLDLAGEALTERTRLETPSPATPEAVLAIIDELVKIQHEFDRVSVGFPGVVLDGVIKTAPNLDPSWRACSTTPLCRGSASSRASASRW
jgi:polyphosphate glucokinase